MSAPQPPDPDRFHAARPSDLREPAPSHHLAYVIRRLDAEIARLIPALAVGPGDRILDFGCADLPYRDLFDPAADYVGADLPGNPDASVEVGPDGRVPVADASFDAVLSTQALEHVADPGTYVEECFRVLRPGGRLLITTHGTMVFHPDPVDLWRWTSQGLERVLAGAGFEVERVEGIVGLSATGLQLLLEGILIRLPTRAHRPVSRLFQALIGLADRLSRPRDRRLNALVFAVVARRPG